jgi:ABC-type arginine/histidine transport system permease subunit
MKLIFCGTIAITLATVSLTIWTVLSVPRDCLATPANTIWMAQVSVYMALFVGTTGLAILSWVFGCFQEDIRKLQVKD